MPISIVIVNVQNLSGKNLDSRLWEVQVILVLRQRRRHAIVVNDKYVQNGKSIAPEKIRQARSGLC